MGHARRPPRHARWQRWLLPAVLAAALLFVALHEAQRPGGQTGGTPPAGTAPSVLVVQTHRKERYDRAACEGADRLAPGPGDVVQAARLLASSLLARDVAARHEPAFGEDPAAGDAYGHARPTLQALLRRWPSVRLVIDVHRDSLGHRDATARFRDRPAARVLWVVGSLPRQRGADWWPNLVAAGRLTETLQREAPALVRGIWVKPGPYNQDLGPVSVLVEIGGSGSCPAEVARAIPPLADALAAWASGASARAQSPTPRR